MLIQLAVGASLIVATVLIHSFCLTRLIILLVNYGPTMQIRLPQNWSSLMLAMTVLGIFFAHIVEIWVWAVVYLLTNEVHTFESAIYMSTVTFTTLGFGDIIFSEKWRLLSSIEGANGMLLFGWSTAFIFEVMRRVWPSRPQEAGSPTVHPLNS